MFSQISLLILEKLIVWELISADKQEDKVWYKGTHTQSSFHSQPLREDTLVQENKNPVVAKVHYRAVSIYHVSLYAHSPNNASAELPSNLGFAMEKMRFTVLLLPIWELLKFLQACVDWNFTV